MNPIINSGQLIWTILPAGLAKAADNSDLLRASIMLSPRLISASAKPTLGDPGFELFHSWPQVAQSLTFQLQFKPNLSVVVPIRSDTIGPDTSALDNNLWAALFQSSLGVTSHTPDDHSNSKFTSYNIRENYNNIVTAYRPDPTSVQDPATATPAALRQAAKLKLAKLVPSTENERSMFQTHLRQLKATYRGLTSSHMAEAAEIDLAHLHFAEMTSFYEGLAKGARNRFQASKGRPLTKPHFDFHTALTAIARYPFLQRTLGLVFDIRVPFGAALAGIPGDGIVRVVVRIPPSAASLFEPWTMAFPWTLYHLDRAKGVFMPTPSTVGSQLGLDGGMLYLPDPDNDFTAMSLDLQSVAQRTNQALAQFQKDTTRKAQAEVLADTVSTPDMTVPAPRSYGLSFARTGLSDHIAAMLNRQSIDLEGGLSADPSGSQVQLNAEDLLRGFRVDIRTVGDPTWRSLHLRAGTYTFTNSKITKTHTDEGLISLQTFNPDVNDPNNPAHWVHETLFRWLGWSLSVPRPGKAIGPEGKAIGVTDQGTSNLPLTVQFDPVPGLPRLRFGKTYECRLRAVDVAGNSFDLTMPIDEKYTLLLGKYLRFDPLIAPVMLMKDPPKPGESVDRLVIRSDINAPSVETAERCIAPPKTSAQMAEWHGMFDTANGVDPNAYATLARLDGNFPDRPYGNSPPAVPPYLPDPLALGAAMYFSTEHSVPTPTPVQVTFDGTWPGLQTFRLVLQEGIAEPHWDPAQRVLRVQLPKAGVKQASLSSYMGDDLKNEGTSGLGLFDSWDSAKNLVKNSTRFRGSLAQFLARIRQEALQGCNPQLTPARGFTLVHAVQRPLVQPRFPNNFMATRREGDTFCGFLSGGTPVDGASTDSLELFAQWDEPVDDGINPPSRKASTTRVWRYDVATNYTGVLFGDTKHEFGDTKYRRVTYWMVATTRFREYFPDSIASDPAQITQASNRLTIDVPSAARPPAPKVLYVVPTFGWETQASQGAHLSRTRSVGLRVYLDRPWYSTGDGEVLGVVVPIKHFPPPSVSNGDGNGGFHKPPKADGVDKQNAPSGDPGPEPPLAVPPDIAPFVTQWGADPAFAATGISSPFAPLPKHFTNATSVTYGADYPDHGSSELCDFALVAFNVGFEPPDAAAPDRPADPGRDPHNGRWFCDIEIGAGAAYFPFIRLALVRFQPNGWLRGEIWGSDLRASRSVLADFVQLAPNRTASVVSDPNDSKRLTVSVTGPSYQENLRLARPVPRVAVSVQMDGGDPGSPLWIPAGETELTWNSSAGLANVVWSGTVELPSARGAKPMRLMIREYEQLPADSGDRSDINATTVTERLVYADVFSI